MQTQTSTEAGLIASCGMICVHKGYCMKCHDGELQKGKTKK